MNRLERGVEHDEGSPLLGRGGEVGGIGKKSSPYVERVAAEVSREMEVREVVTLMDRNDPDYWKTFAISWATARNALVRSESTSSFSSGGKQRRLSDRAIAIANGAAKAAAEMRDSGTLVLDAPPEPIREAIINHNIQDLDEHLQRVIDEEFPRERSPTARQVINVGELREGRARYRPGDWVEVRGPDMMWRLNMVTRVIKLAPKDWNWDDPRNAGKHPKWRYFYHAGRARMMRDYEVRSSEEGLKRLFGHRPWIWQQWACIKLEDRLRFQKGHSDDFMSLDVTKFVHELWQRWLKDDRNRDFAELYGDPRIGDFGRAELVEHIMTPFTLIESIKEDQDKEWDFSADSDVSIFTYLSVLGSGLLVPIAITAIMVAIPMILVDVVGNGSITGVHSEGDMAASTMAIVVLLLYLFRVVPDTLSSFYNTAGLGQTLSSRLLSMRYQLWLNDGDIALQKIGFGLDLFINTSYVCFIYMLNIYIVVNTSSVLEILLNSLAFEFIIRVDEEISESKWWDPDSRWIRAGVVQLVLQNIVKPKALASPSLFSKTFDFSAREASHLCGDNPKLLMNKELSIFDSKEWKYMTVAEIIGERSKVLAKDLENPTAIYEYEKPIIIFGVLERIFCQIFMLDRRGLFQRFRDYRTWSLWDNMLFAGELPNLNEIFKFEGEEEEDEAQFTHSRTIQRKLDRIIPTAQTPFANFNVDTRRYSYEEIFVRHFFRVLLFFPMCENMARCLRKRDFWGFLFYAAAGPLRWFMYMLQLLLPIYVIVAIVGVSIHILQLPVEEGNQVHVHGLNFTL